MAKANDKQRAFRDSRTGRFVSEAYARRHPATTQSETNPKPKRSK